MVSGKQLERLRDAFDRFGRSEARVQGSCAYERLSNIVRDDETLLELAAKAGPRQPPPNLLFGAVHYLLAESQAESAHPLAAYYPSLGGTREPDEVLADTFRAFVEEHREAVVALLRTRLVQTNEVRRCAALLPAFRYASDEAGGAPLALIEIGPSAGLNLLFDRYCYDYAGTPAGDLDSPLTIRTEVHGAMPPVNRVPAVASRYGIDLNALDVRSDEDVRWLQALVWPEHHERRETLARAIEVARRDPPRVVSADVFEDLPPAIEGAPTEAAVVVFATFVLNQFSAEMLARLKSLLLDASRGRPVRVLTMGANEWFGAWHPDDGATEIWLGTLEGRRGSVRRLLRGDPHGWWVTWAPGDPKDW